MGLANLPIFATAADTHKSTPTMKKITRRRKPTHDTAEILEARIAPATFTVINLSDPGVGSLRQAVLDSEANTTADTIVFAKNLTGNIVLTNGHFFITQPLKVKGPGAGKILIDGNSFDRIFDVEDSNNAKDAAFSISGLSLYNGDAGVNKGGAIFSTESLTMKGCVVFGSTADSGGGGVYVKNDTNIKALISDSTISGTSSTNGCGGGLYLRAGGGVTVLNSTVSGNTAKVSGGGAYLGIKGNPSIPNHKITVTGSVFSQNSSDSDGGGLAILVGSHKVAITKTEISGNTAKRNGGGLYLSSAIATLTGCTIAGNSTTAVGGNGGGVYLKASSATFKDSHILGNSAFEDGGGIGFDGVKFDGDILTVNGGNIAGNNAARDGGGIYGTNGGKVVSKSVNFQGNSATRIGGGISTAGTGTSATKLEISGGIFRGNSASIGGAVVTAGDGTVAIKNAKFNSNKTTGTHGGAIWLDTTATASIMNCLFTSNTSAAKGGAIVLSGTGGTFTLKGITVLGNSSADAGGGLAVFGSANVDISNSTIKANYSASSGGGIYFEGNRLTIKTSTITGNVAKSDCGGIYLSYISGPVTVDTTAKLIGNTAPANPDKNF